MAARDESSERSESRDALPPRRRRSHRDRDLEGRDLVAHARATAAGDPEAAEALAAGALGSDDAAVAGEAALALGEAAAARDRRRLRRND